VVSTWQAARLLQCDPSTILLRIEDGTLKATRLGPRSHYRISYDSVMELKHRMDAELAGNA